MALEATLEATVDGEVKFRFTVLNAGDSQAELQFQSGKVADVAVFDGGEEIWRWSDGRMFTQALQSWTLGPGESTDQQFTWEDPPSGTYTARATLEAGRNIEATTSVTV